MKKMENWGFLALRLSVGIIFIMQGWGKLNGGIEMFAGMLESKGFFLPMLFAYLVAITEFLGGLAIIFGVFVRFFAQLLAIIMLVALLTVHLSGPFAGAMAVIALLGSTLALTFLGGGNLLLTKKDWTLFKQA